MPRERAADRIRREAHQQKLAFDAGREEAFAELRKLLGVLTEEDVRRIVREELDSHEWRFHDTSEGDL